MPQTLSRLRIHATSGGRGLGGVHVSRLRDHRQFRMAAQGRFRTETPLFSDIIHIGRVTCVRGGFLICDATVIWDATTYGTQRRNPRNDPSGGIARRGGPDWAPPPAASTAVPAWSDYFAGGTNRVPSFASLFSWRLMSLPIASIRLMLFGLNCGSYGLRVGPPATSSTASNL